MYCIDDEKFFCSTSLAMRYIGGKWKAVILIHLGRESRRYSELKKDIGLITERTLSLQLKELEADGLITRTVHTSKPPLMVTYGLTEFGRSLIPVLSAISQWGKVAAENESRIKILQ
ncbi:MAG: MarR family transcriptional regulator [Bacteroidetes bacterium]|jgi:DNA-binding HxlR family transcriptional regulator|nr:MarR family transcriptional regulator [Bacteroidota bacterium]